MRALPKKPVNQLLLWLVLLTAGFAISYFYIRPMLNGWYQTTAFSDDVPYNIHRLIVANIIYLPGFIVAILALVSAIKRKTYLWSVVHVIGILAALFLIYGETLPIVITRHFLEN
ncbi:MAG TPA: hypothetical protein VLG47_04235 [Candidatus Saccharimonadales bacterium]|nr:hypothetical protein [Candidatus Saccharimonadales bacterium]